MSEKIFEDIKIIHNDELILQVMAQTDFNKKKHI